MSVSWSWKHHKDEKLFGSKSYETDGDFLSEKSAKNAVDLYFTDMECEKCGHKKLGGSNIQIEITRVDLHHDVKKKGIFGGEKTVEEHWKTVYRIGSFLFPTAHLFSSGGHLKCSNSKCGHRMGSPGFFGQWAANVAKGG